MVSSGIVCYAVKEGKPFWFSSLGQMIQFGTIKFRRTFKNYFGQFAWIEKSHYNSRASLHEAPTKNRIVYPIVKLDILDDNENCKKNSTLFVLKVLEMLMFYSEYSMEEMVYFFGDYVNFKLNN